jgi:hypothetical protein
MKVYIPKVKISKYFKTKYQGAFIPPSQLNQILASKMGLNMAIPDS